VAILALTVIVLPVRIYTRSFERGIPELISVVPVESVVQILDPFQLPDW
jgi:hypothetical protein